jgi:molybdenum cofactor cytidylyltransferase
METSVCCLGNPQVKRNLCSAICAAMPARFRLNGMEVPAIILAAGASRRLGQPKQLVRMAGETLLARTIRLAREAGARPLIAVLGANHEHIASTVDLSQVHSFINHDWEQGIATSIHAGIEAVRIIAPAAKAVLLLVCDQPRLSAEHLRRLIEASKESVESAIVASQYAGIAGIPAIFPSSQFANLLALRGDSGARHILRNPRCTMTMVPFEGGDVDIDTPGDLTENEFA